VNSVKIVGSVLTMEKTEGSVLTQQREREAS
jgi:hypothetical protein